jgi:hypothetical protein
MFTVAGVSHQAFPLGGHIKQPKALVAYYY